jgi:hypothetical protein
MSAHYVSFLTPYGDGYQFLFRSREAMCRVLGISSPYNKCIAYAPYARNAPYCSRPINRINQSRVPNILDDLYDAIIPSRNAESLLDTLSSHVVCGITGWHQNKASEVLSEWLKKIWDEFVIENRRDLRRYANRQQYLRMPDWEREIQPDRDESYYSSSDRDTYPVPSTHSYGERSPEYERESSSQGYSQQERVMTPDYSSFYSEEEVQPTPDQSPQPTSRATFSVYHDPVPTSAVVLSSTSTTALSTNEPRDVRPALNQLDHNRPVHRFIDQASPSWSHDTAEAEPVNTQQDAGVPSTSGDEEIPRVESSGSEDQVERETHDTTDEVDVEQGTSTSSTSRVEETSRVEPSSSEDQAGLETHDTTDEVDTEQGTSTSSTTRAVQTPRVESSNSEDRVESEALDTVEAEHVEASNHEEILAPDLLAISEQLFDDHNTGAPTDPSPAQAITARPGFSVYSQVTPSSQFKQLLNTITQTVRRRGRVAGYIYAFARPSEPGILKIGYVQAKMEPLRPYSDPVDNRLNQWRSSCGKPIVEVFRTYIECAAERIESLVHLTLREYRRKEYPPCSRCLRESQRRRGTSNGGNHDEWFEIEEQVARQVIDGWASFAKESPYDSWGRLNAFWSEKCNLERVSIRSAAGGGGQPVEAITNWVERMPEMVAESRRILFTDIIGTLRAFHLS